MNITDQEIIEKIKQEDHKTISGLRKEYYMMVRYFVSYYRYSNGTYSAQASVSDIDDLLQETFYIIIKKILNEELVLTSKLSTYFYSIFKNLLKVHLRKKLLDTKYRVHNIQNHENDEKFELIYDKNLKQNAFDYYFDKLSDVCRNILNHYWLELSVAEIAKKLGNTKNYIMKRKYECKNRLIKLIKENPDNI